MTESGAIEFFLTPEERKKKDMENQVKVLIKKVSLLEKVVDSLQEEINKIKEKELWTY